MPQSSILSQIPIDLGDDLKLRFATPADTDALAEFNTRLPWRGERRSRYPRLDVRRSSHLQGKRFHRC